jgi:ferredoxin
VPRLLFLPQQRTLEVPRGTRLIDAIRSARLPIARSCGDVLLCGRCAVYVLAGEVGRESRAEALSKRRARVEPTARLACALRVRGDLSLTTSYWGPLQ